MVQDYFPPERKAEPKISLAKRFAVFYARQFEFIKRMKRHLRFSFYIFLLTAAAGTVFFLLKPGLAVHWMADFKAEFIRRHPRSLIGLGMFFHIAENNARVSLITCLMGLVPFYLPAIWSLIANATVLCLIFIVGLIQHEQVVMRFLTLVLPHGIVELPTMIFVAGFSLYLSSQMTKRLFRKKPQLTIRTADLFKFLPQDDLPDRQEAIVEIVHMFAGVILPLVLIAAAIETFITPFVYRLFA